MNQSLKVSRRSKFGVGGADAGRTVRKIADYLEKTLLGYFFIFVGQNFKTRYLYVCFHVKYNLEP